MAIGPNVGTSWFDPNQAVAQTITVDAVAAGTTPGLTVQNTTAATVGAQVQRSPSVWQYGRGWDSDDAVSRVFGMGWQMRPVAGATVTGALHLMTDLAGSVADANVIIDSNGTIQFGATPSTATNAFLRMTHGVRGISYRNQANNADVTVLSYGLSGNDILALGNTASFHMRTEGSIVRVRNSTIDLMTWESAQIESVVPVWRFQRAVASPSLRQENLASTGTTQTLWLAAQGSASANDSGGRLHASGGRRGGSGNYGGVALALNQDDATFHTLVEVIHLANARRITALNRGVALTTTEMPTNTGDLVTYIGNAAVVPSANPVSGGIMYAEGGDLKYRSPGGKTTTIATNV
jgi:hypothetical protein